MVEITSEEQKKVKRMKRAEDSFTDFWDHIKRTNILIIQVPQEEKKMKGYEKIFEEIIVENFPNLEKKIVNQVQEAQSPIQDKLKEKHAKTHTNQTNKERILKTARDKQQVNEHLFIYLLVAVFIYLYIFFGKMSVQICPFFN